MWAAQILRSVEEIKLKYFDLIDPDTIRPVEIVDVPVRAAMSVMQSRFRT